MDCEWGENSHSSPCLGATMVEHIVHIDGVTGSSPVATTREPNRKVRLVLYKEEE